MSPDMAMAELKANPGAPHRITTLTLKGGKTVSWEPDQSAFRVEHNTGLRDLLEEATLRRKLGHKVLSLRRMP